jgi:AraC-like DNA-binding protein
MFYWSALPASIIGPLALIYVKSLVSSNHDNLGKVAVFHFSLSLVFFVLLYLVKCQPEWNSRMDVDEKFITGEGDFPLYLKFFIFLHIPAYYFYIFIYLGRVKHSCENMLFFRYAKKFILSLLLFLAFFYSMQYLDYLSLNIPLNGITLAPFVLFFTFVFILFHAIKESTIYGVKELVESRMIPMSSRKLLKHEEITPEHVEQAIRKHFAEEKLYTDKELNLKKCSAALGIPPRQFSIYLNNKLNMNFNDFVNSYRVDAAKKMLPAKENLHLKLEAIGALAGFRSRASFFSTFKKHTGLTPNAFKNSFTDQKEPDQ